jgi:hypothetical protein
MDWNMEGWSTAKVAGQTAPPADVVLKNIVMNCVILDSGLSARPHLASDTHPLAEYPRRNLL